MAKRPLPSRAKQMATFMKAARSDLRAGNCESALENIALFEYARGAYSERRSERARDDWKLTSGASLNLRSDFRDRCVKPRRK